MFATPAFAQTASSASSGGPASTIFFLGQFVLIGLIFYFLIIRPQQKRAKEHQALIAAVKKGDQVVTAGGIVGKVTKVEERMVEVEIATGVKVRVIKATLTDVDSGTSKPAND
ncbi:MAG: preprotein translocase subunit YajC [Chakrabartia sp.]